MTGQAGDQLRDVRHGHTRLRTLDVFIGRNLVVGRHGLGGFEREAVQVHGEAAQHRTFGRPEQLPAPVDDRTQRLVPGRSASRTRGEHPEAVAEPLRQLVHAVRANPRGRQLQGQRQTVEPPTDVRDRCGVAGIDREPGHHGGHALREQPYRTRTLQRGEVVTVRQVQRRHRPQQLAGPAQGFPAGGQDAQLGRGLQQEYGQLGDRREQALAVVQHQQQAFVPEGAHQVFGQRGAWCRRKELGERLVVQVECRGDLLGQESGSLVRCLVPVGRVFVGTDAGQVDDPAPVRQFVDQLSGGLHREPGLADAAGTGQGDQPAGRQQSTDMGHRFGSTHETGQRCREVGAGTRQVRPRRLLRRRPSLGPGGPRGHVPGFGRHLLRLDRHLFRLGRDVVGLARKDGGGRRERRRQRGVLREDGLVHPGEFRSGFHAVLLHQALSYAPEAGQRLGLPSELVQRTQPQRLQPLTDRMPVGQLRQLAEHRSGLAECETRLGEVLARDQPLFLQASDRGQGERLVGELGQRLTSPERQRIGEQPCPDRRLRGGTRPHHQVHEPVRVHLIWLHLHCIPGRTRGDERAATGFGVVQHPPEPGDHGL